VPERGLHGVLSESYASLAAWRLFSLEQRAAVANDSRHTRQLQLLHRAYTAITCCSSPGRTPPRLLILEASPGATTSTTPPPPRSTHPQPPHSRFVCHLQHHHNHHLSTPSTAITMADVATAPNSSQQVPLDTIPISPVDGNTTSESQDKSTSAATDDSAVKTVFHDPENFNVKHPLMNTWTLWFTKPPSGKVRGHL
jgi:hypothetical protein